MNTLWAILTIPVFGIAVQSEKRLKDGVEEKREYYISQFSRMEELLLRRKYDNVYAIEPE